MSDELNNVVDDRSPAPAAAEPLPDLETDADLRREFDRADDAPPVQPSRSVDPDPPAPAAPAPVEPSSPQVPAAAPSAPPAAPAPAPAAQPPAAPAPAAPTAPAPAAPVQPAAPIPVSQVAATLVQTLGNVQVDDPGAEGGKITLRQLSIDYPAQFQSTVAIASELHRLNMERIAPLLAFAEQQMIVHQRESLLDAIGTHGVPDARAIAEDPQFLDQWLPKQSEAILRALDSNDPRAVAQVMRLYRLDHPANPAAPATALVPPPAPPRRFDHSRTLRGGLPKTPPKADNTEEDARDEWERDLKD